MGKSSVLFVVVFMGILIFIGYTVNCCLKKVVAASCLGGF